jgi:riboflavin kinase/FMN adenylyltransferase
MKILYDLKELALTKEPIGIALGTFDGLHIGHQKVIGDMVVYCKKHGYKSVVYTFSNHPRELTRNGHKVQKLVSNEDKEKLIEATGADFLLMIPFDEAFMKTSPEQFVRQYLIDGMNVKAIAVGFDYRFGKGAEGDVDLLKALMPKYGYELIVIEPVSLNGHKISSSEIRDRIKHGDMAMARKMLGRPYSVTGPVIMGKQVGRKLGFPTANILPEVHMNLIKPGVYVSYTQVGDVLYPSLSNVGYNPTFEQTELNLESYLLDFDEDIYGEVIRIFFIEHIRDEAKFPSLEALIARMNEDLSFAKTHFFDKLSPEDCQIRLTD